MALVRKPSKGKLAAVAVVVAAVANILGLGLSSQAASAATTTGTVTITQSCYDLGYGSITAVLTSPLGAVQEVSGTMSAWAKGGIAGTYGGQVSVTGGIDAIVHVYPGTYAVQLSARDSLGTTYGYSGTMVMGSCNNDVAGIQADPSPGGGYLAYTNGAAVLSHGPNHAADQPSFLVTDPHAPIVGFGANASNANGASYYFAAADGGVFTVNAPFYGSASGLALHAPIVGMALTPDHGGYWLVGADGGVFAFGDAGYFGSMGGQFLRQPIVGMAVDAATGGYWLVARDGGVFAFNAPYYGSPGTLDLSAPVVGMESAPDGTGYRLVSSDGGIFAYNEPFDGSMAGQHLAAPVVGMAEDPSTGGYWIVSSDGGVFAFGAPFYGAGNQPAP
ncbi:MAG: hypothetical protein WAL61_09375 [Acidimicrobiales bacterium]